MRRYLKFYGSDFILGEIVGEDSFYWRVRRKPTRDNPRMNIVCHPKWNTQVITEEEICDRFINS